MLLFDNPLKAWIVGLLLWQLQEDSHARWFDLNKRFKLELKQSRTFETRSNGVLRLSKCLILSKF